MTYVQLLLVTQTTECWILELNNEMERTWKDMAVAKFNVLYPMSSWKAWTVQELQMFPAKIHSFKDSIYMSIFI